MRVVEVIYVKHNDLAALTAVPHLVVNKIKIMNSRSKVQDLIQLEVKENCNPQHCYE